MKGNMRPVRIAPSILAADFARLGEQVREAQAAGADAIHVDVMDGHFVPNITIGPLVVRALRGVTGLPLYVHLMIERPEQFIGDFVRAGASLVTVHVEACVHLHRTLEQIREAGALPAVALNPGTSLMTLEHVLGDVDQVQVMTVDPGFGGQPFIAGMLPKIRQLREMLDAGGYAGCAIEVDGGINADTLGAAVQAGADVLVMGQAIFGDPQGIGPAIERYRSLAQKERSALVQS
jgi:ribulose-phosphate 3-epimerase